VADGAPDPLGKRALFGVPSGDITGRRRRSDPSTVTLPVGKRALYSGASLAGPPEQVPVDDQRGSVTVRCQRCQQRSQISLLDLLILQFPVGVWFPRGRFDRRMTCPSCRKRAWCSVTLRRD
jgi:transcription elongation factor Elf1